MPNKGYTENGEDLTEINKLGKTVKTKTKRDRLYGIFAIAILLYQPLVIFSNTAMAIITVFMSVALVVYLGLSLKFFRDSHKLLGSICYLVFAVFVVGVGYFSYIILTSNIDSVTRQITVYNLLIGFMLSLGEAFSKIYWMLPLKNRSLSNSDLHEMYVNKLGIIFFAICYILYSIYCYLFIANIYNKDFLLTVVVGWLIIVPIMLVVQGIFKLSLCKSDKYEVKPKESEIEDKPDFELL